MECGVAVRSHLGCMRGDGMPMSTSSEHMHDPSFQRPRKLYSIDKSEESITERKYVFSRRGVYKTIVCFAVLAPSC